MIGSDSIEAALLSAYLSEDGVNELLLEGLGVDLEAAVAASLRFANVAPRATNPTVEAASFLSGMITAARLAAG